MKVFIFYSGETEWIAAISREAAIEFYDTLVSFKEFEEEGGECEEMPESEWDSITIHYVDESDTMPPQTIREAVAEIKDDKPVYLASTCY